MKPNPASPWASLSYRTDIEGLRGLAVLLVIFFHAFPTLIRGGFLGVDVFFAISGYLITKIITANLEQGTFTFSSFYSKRILRIFPSLILMLSGTLLLAVISLLPEEMRSLGKELSGGAGFISNLFFWKEMGYFESASEFKPLLHLWSIGVEEQFYILWPLLLWFVFRIKIRTRIIVGLITALSFAFCVYWVHHDAPFAFFFPFSRLWELSLGGLLSCISIKRRSNTVAALSLLAIITGSFFIDETFFVPGLWTLLPVLATGAWILYGQHTFVDRHLLSTPLFRWFGKISYSLYLWHWPLLYFARLHFQKEVDVPLAILVILASIILSYLTVRFWENPIRFGHFKVNPTKRLFLGNAALLALGLLIWKLPSIPYLTDDRRFNELGKMNLKQLQWDSYSEYCSSTHPLPKGVPWWFCMQNKKRTPDIMLIGDSHANHLYPGLVSNENFKDKSILNVGGTIPVLDVDRQTTYQFYDNPYNYMPEIDEYYRELVAQSPQTKYVILSALWPNFVNGQQWGQRYRFHARKPSEAGLTDLELFTNGLDRFISFLEKNGKRVVIALGVPIISDERTVMACLIPRPLSKLNEYIFDYHCKIKVEKSWALEDMKSILTHLEHSHPNLKIFDPTPAFCPNDECATFDEKGILLRRDMGHLSVRGSELFAEFFVKWATLNFPEILR